MPETQPLVAGFWRGYWPTQTIAGPGAVEGTCFEGRNVWFGPTGIGRSWSGIKRRSAAEIGARIIALDHDRASIGGSSTGVSIIRHQGGALVYLADTASQQVYINEAAVSGLVTNATPYKVNVAIPDGSGGYLIYPAGLTAPAAVSVAAVASTNEFMVGPYSIRVRSSRSATKAYSNASDAFDFSLDAGQKPEVTFGAINSSEGQDQWIAEGTRSNEGPTGPWREIETFYATARGTFTATNGTLDLTAGDGTFFDLDLRAGDTWTIDSADYVIDTVLSATQARLTTNFSGTTGAGKTATIKKRRFEWRDEEIQRELSDDHDPPPLSTGIITANNFIIYWGTGGEGDGAPGSAFAIAEGSNPEHVALEARSRTSGGETIINALAAEGRLYFMTKGSLQVVSFSGGDVAFAARPAWASGFSNPLAGTIYNNVFYGHAGSPVRSRAESDADETFAAPVKKLTRGWDAANVVVAPCPKNRAVVYFHYYSELGITLALPFMVDTEFWSTPMIISGQVTSGAAVGDRMEIVIKADDEHRCYTFDELRDLEDDEVAVEIDWYLVTAFFDFGAEGVDKTVTEWQYTGEGSSVRLYRASNTFPDVTDLSEAAIGEQALAAGFQHHPRAQRNYALCKSAALRVDGNQADQEAHELAIWAYATGGRR